MMVSKQPQDGHTPEGSVLKTGNLALRLNSQNLHQATTFMDGHLPSQEWLPTNPRMVIHQKEVNYRLGIWHLNFIEKTNTG